VVTVDLVIPMLNEAANVSPLFDALDALRHRGVIRRVVVGDNGSTDGSPNLCEQRGAIVVREPRRGYGGACLKALEWIDSQPNAPHAIAFLDADLADDPESLPLLINALTDHDLAIGCRPNRADPGALNMVQRVGNVVATSRMLLATGRRYRDLGPMRTVRWETLRAMGMNDRTWGWTVEMQTKAAMLGRRVAQIDVPYHRRRHGRSKISGSILGSIRAGWKITTTIWRVRLTWRAGAAGGSKNPPIPVPTRIAESGDGR